jgi:hypothetical protein
MEKMQEEHAVSIIADKLITCSRINLQSLSSRKKHIRFKHQKILNKNM